MSENKKLWKVTLTVAQLDCEDKQEIERKTFSEIFYDYSHAEAFAHCGFKSDPLHKVLTVSIEEYEVTSKREFQNKTDDGIIFGKYKKPLVWDVIDETDDAQLLLCRDFVEHRLFDPNSNDWEESDIRSWLNSYSDAQNNSGYDYTNIGFLNSFTKSELRRMRDYIFVDKDAIFLLSEDEYKAHKGNIKGIKSWWWLRSNGTNSVADVLLDGSVDYSCFFSVLGVRPALWMYKE